MKLIEFIRHMRPHQAGEKRAVPDDLAERLIADGAAKVVPSVFDRQREPATAGEVYVDRARRPGRPRQYQTR